MVAHCVNPGCRKEFKLLNAGDLYAHEKRHSDTEFFWLCSDCTSEFYLCLDPTGGVRLRLRGERGLPPHPDGSLRLVSRAAKPAARLQGIPAGEQASSDVFAVGPLLRMYRARGISER